MSAVAFDSGPSNWKITAPNNFAVGDVVVVRKIVGTELVSVGAYEVKTVDSGHAWFTVNDPHGSDPGGLGSSSAYVVQKIDSQDGIYYRYYDSLDPNDGNRGQLAWTADSSALKLPMNFSAIDKTTGTYVDAGVADLVGYNAATNTGTYLNSASGLIVGYDYNANGNPTFEGTSGDSGITQGQGVSGGQAGFVTVGGEICFDVFLWCPGTYTFSFSLKEGTGSGGHIKAEFGGSCVGGYTLTNAFLPESFTVSTGLGNELVELCFVGVDFLGYIDDISITPSGIPGTPFNILDPGFEYPTLPSGTSDSAPFGADSATGVAPGYVHDIYVSQGIQGDHQTKETFDYVSHGSGSSEIWEVSKDSQYRNADTTGEQATTFCYAWYSGTDGPLSITTTLPAVLTSQNGSGSAATIVQSMDSLGREVSLTNANGFETTTSYDDGTGAITQIVTDAGSGHLNLTTDIVPDSLGRPHAVIAPNGTVTVFTYDDADHEDRVYPGWGVGGMATQNASDNHSLTDAGHLTGGSGSYVGQTLVITGGTDAGQTSVVTAFNATTHTLTLSPSLTSDVTTTTQYILSPLLTTGPIEVDREHRAVSTDGYYNSKHIDYTETLTELPPAISGWAINLGVDGLPDGTEPIGTIYSLSRQLMDAGGQVVETDDYFNLVDVAYSTTAPQLSVSGTASSTAGDSVTLVDSTLSPTGLYVGCTLTVVGGTDNGDVTTVTAYDGSTRTLTVSPAFTGPTDNTTQFVLSGASNNTVGGNYHATTFWYDEAGNLAKTLTPSGTIYRTVYDVFRRPVSHWVGTDDTPTTGFWSPTNTAGTNLVDVENDAYDNGNAAVPPTLSSTTVSGGSGGDTIYYVSISWVDGIGDETPASMPVTFDVPASQRLVVTPPTAPGGMSGYNVYVSTREGMEELQNSAPIGTTTAWTQATGGALVGGQLVNFSGTGDGNLTEMIQSPGPGAQDRVTQYLYDFQDRQIAEKDGVQANELSTFQLAPRQTWSEPGNFATNAAVADVNGDGKPDIILGDMYNAWVSVLLGNGNGTFQPYVTVAAGTRTRTVAAADVNGDGKIDIITSNAADNTVSVLLGNGNGTFQTQKTFAVGTTPWWVTTTDVNGDGKLDLVTANVASNTVSVLLGNGNGTFQAQTTFSVTGAPSAVVAADINGDGKMDLVVQHYSNDHVINVLLGNGNGTFQASTTVAASSYSRGGFVVTDLNGDGKPDIAVSSKYGTSHGTVGVLLGNGNGTFGTETTYATTGSYGSVGVIAADLNGDGVADLAVGDYSSGNLAIFLGNGNGTFQAQQTYSAGASASPIPVAATDLNGDGTLDLVVCNTLIHVGVETVLNQTPPHVNRPIYYNTLDNLDEVTGSYQYDGDGIPLSDFASGLPGGDASQLRAETLYSYDELGQQYEQQTFNVNPISGSVSGASLNTYDWYDDNGNLVKELSPGGLVQKYAYDAADREIANYSTDGGGDAAPLTSGSLSDAKSFSGDIVLEETDTQYDASGNPIFTIDRQRFHDDSSGSTGALGTPTTGVHARDYYSADYYDAADRLTDSVDIGTNSGTSLSSRPAFGSIPSGSLVTGDAYDSAGNVSDVTDPRGIHSLYYYDMLGRTTQQVLGHTVSGTPVASIDQTTDYTYDGNDDVLTLTAEVPGGNNQVTQYVYGVGATAGVDLFSNDLIQKIEYPDPTYGTPSTSCSGWQTFGYNYQGDETSFTDQNGTTHRYDYDVLDRLTADVVTALGSGVDGAVLRLGYNFNSAGLPYQQTTYSDTAGSHVVNQVQDEYNGYGQLVQQYQEHSGSVNPASSVSVQYQYDQPSGANYSRLSAMIYPNGRKVDYVYNSGLDSNISRISELDDDGGSSAGLLQSYLYLGLSTIVQETDGNGDALTYIQQSGDPYAGGDGGDQYTGLDRFGRVIDQNWINVSTGASTDRLQYGYDADGNVLYKNNILYPAFSELYHANSSTSGDNASAYDALNRIQADGEYGSLSASGNNGSGGASLDTSSGSFSNFTTDVSGNITSRASGGITYAYNSANELTSSGSTTATYDNNGNTLTNPGGPYVYNAWNQIVSVTIGGVAGDQTYHYDALMRRVFELSYSHDVYFDAGVAMGGNVIEERFGTHSDQQAWGLAYQNELILRDDNFASSGSLGKAGSGLGRRIYAQQDANWSVSSLVDASGAVLNRYYYDAFGNGTQYGATFGSSSGAFNEWLYGYQGGRLDLNTGIYRFGVRDYAAVNGRWMEKEPFDGLYVDGTNLYQAMGGNPVSYVDPSGLLYKVPTAPAPAPPATGVAKDIQEGLQEGIAVDKAAAAAAAGMGAVDLDNYLYYNNQRYHDLADRFKDSSIYRLKESIDKSINDAMMSVLDPPPPQTKFPADPRAAAALAQARAKLQQQQQAAAGQGGGKSKPPKQGPAQPSNNNPCPKGGTYTLIDPVSGRTARVGRTNNLARRRAEHARNFPGLIFYVDKMTDDYAEQRGREQLLIDMLSPPLNTIRGIDPKNPLRDYYLQRGRELDREEDAEQ